MTKKPTKPAVEKAKKPTKPAVEKAKKPTKPAVEAGESVNDSAQEKTAPAPAEAKKGKLTKAQASLKIADQFAELRKTIGGLSTGNKIHRRVRWALKTLAMAEENANRAVEQSD